MKKEIHFFLRVVLPINGQILLLKKVFPHGNIENTRFEGKIKLGAFSGTIEVEKSVSKKCGIYNSCISNCEIAG